MRILTIFLILLLNSCSVSKVSLDFLNQEDKENNKSIFSSLSFFSPFKNNTKNGMNTMLNKSEEEEKELEIYVNSLTAIDEKNPDKMILTDAYMTLADIDRNYQLINQIAKNSKLSDYDLTELDILLREINICSINYFRSFDLLSNKGFEINPKLKMDISYEFTNRVEKYNYLYNKIAEN